MAHPEQKLYISFVLSLCIGTFVDVTIFIGEVQTHIISPLGFLKRSKKFQHNLWHSSIAAARLTFVYFDVKEVVLQTQTLWSHLSTNFYEIGIYGKLGTRHIIVGHNINTWLFYWFKLFPNLKKQASKNEIVFFYKTLLVAISLELCGVQIYMAYRSKRLSSDYVVRSWSNMICSDQWQF